MPKKRKGYKKHLKVDCKDAAILAEAIRSKCKEYGLCLVIKKVESTKTTFFHWMFDTNKGKRMLDYWPSSGSYYTYDGVRGKVDDPWAALEVAVEKSKSLTSGE